jgi:hypothetical protein
MDRNTCEPRYSRRATYVLPLLGAFLFVLSLYGCSAIPKYTSRNEEDSSAAIRATRASWKDFRSAYPKSNVFVGIAMSGGGSRAANFSAAALAELDRHGFLQHATALSSVSGGSLTAAYYGLFRKDPNKWNWTNLRTKLRTNFFGKFATKMFYPLNLILYFLTDYDRSDMMAEVFDEELYEGMKFRDFGTGTPHILINATNLGESVFPFTEENFSTLRSRLDTYPIAHAVMASGAFPLVFHNVTLRSYVKWTQFALDDLKNPSALARKWQTATDSLSAFIRARLSPSTRDLLNDYDGSGVPPERLQGALVDELNDLINYTVPREADALFNRDTLAVLRLTDDARRDIEEIARAWSGGERARLLLEEAYSEELHRAPPTYWHLYDGGPADNLGIETLLEAARNFYRGAPPGHRPSGCFIFVIDAYQGRQAVRHLFERDTRRFFDFLLDRNAIDATDTMLAEQRDSLMGIGGTWEGIGRRALFKDRSFLRSGWEWYRDVECVTWHITFDRLLAIGRTDTHGFLRNDLSEQVLSDIQYAHGQLEATVKQIATHYKLTGPEECSPEFLQQTLYDAARLLITADRPALAEAYKWFEEHHLKLAPFPADPEPYLVPLPVRVSREKVSCVAKPG